MTRLAAVLLAAITEVDHRHTGEPSECHHEENVREYVAAIPKHIAANLEATCSLCVVCGMQEPLHERFAHPYQPLVPLGDAS